MGNKRKCIIVFIIVALCWAGNIFYYEGTKIDSAIFFKNYREADITGKYDISNDTINYSDVDLRLYYIQDNKNKDICRVEFPELNSGDIFVEPINVQTYGNFTMNCLDFKGSDNSFMHLLEKEFLHKEYFYVTKMNYWTKDNRKYEVNLGKVYFLNKLNDEYTDTIYNQVMAESSSDGTIKRSYTTISGMSIVGVQSHIIDNVKKYVDVSIDSNNVDKISFPMKIDKAKTFDVLYKLKDNSEMTSYSMKMDFIVRSGMVKETMPVEINNDSEISLLKLNYKNIKRLKDDGREAHEIVNK